MDDCVPYVERIKYQIKAYDLPVEEVGIDKGYDTTEIHKELYDLGIKTYTPLVNNDMKSNRKCFPSSVFQYNHDDDSFICPAKNKLTFASVNKSKRKKIYAISQKICKNCSLKSRCMSSNLKHRTLQIPFFQRKASIQRANYGSSRYYEVQRLRRVYCEGNFAIQKDNYNLRSIRKHGNKNVT